MSRGIDLSNVDSVINYDVPPFVQTFVHRVGRTARAGAAGTAYTMVKAAQWRNFKTMMLQAENSFYSQHPSLDQSAAKLMPAYQHALGALKSVLLAEKSGAANAHAPLSDSMRASIGADAPALASGGDVDTALDADLEDSKSDAVKGAAQQQPIDGTDAHQPKKSKKIKL